ncbi:metallophosphoesterase [Cyanobium sp. NIES-981]|uniref:metallophosphoesterase family protein n=1 Tax=Cyanobium sp. NIES-981 TaxID=1851505 RepID=UPI0007DD50C6|nr:metallophosphoesterase [Cyanobium sp. NIES-981]SBO41898.1 Serine/threonine specific protein phosphatase:Purple acid pho [Cyanobium sp. NIES-981]
MPLTRRRLLHLAAAGSGVLAVQALWPRPASSGGGTPAASSQAAASPLRLALISDLNSSYGSTTYVPQVQRGVDLLQSLAPELVICAGDMVAGQKAGLSTGQLDAMWRSFGQQVLDPLVGRGIGFVPAMGNHDASSSRSQGQYVFALDRQRAERFWLAQRPRLGLNLLSAEAFPFRYSLLHGDVFLLVLDASSAFLGADQKRWAQQQLASAAARQARLRLVIGHLPLYAVSQGRDRPGEVLDRPGELLQLMEQGRVNLYVSGHHHAYFPSRVGRLNLLSLGAMGSGPRRLLQSGQSQGQTLTLLELPSGGRELIETTYSLSSLAPLDPATLPRQLQPSAGPSLPRRASRIPIA